MCRIFYGSHLLNSVKFSFATYFAREFVHCLIQRNILLSNMNSKIRSV